MVKRSLRFTSLSPSYLFVEIAKRKADYLAKHPDAKLLLLGIGDTTLPLTTDSAEAMAAFSKGLGTKSGYSGYGHSEGSMQLRSAIQKRFYPGLDASEIFISDGAKCDIARLQQLFGPDVHVALQDPAYPVYFEGSKLAGVTQFTLLPSTPENHFTPDLSLLKGVDLLYLCSPNNPTGTVLSKEALTRIVAWAKKERALIIFDSAYAAFIQDPSLPKSIYEIEGADEVAIEVSSFSKMGGFTGVRLGWSVVPKKLTYSDGKSVRDDWIRLISTLFNGPSNIAEAGGLALLSDSHYEKLIASYMENAHLLKKALQKRAEVFGGDNAPFLWARFPHVDSWTLFDRLLTECQIVATPGSGFGKSGEGFIRFSAFCSRESAEEAALRLEKYEQAYTQS